MSDSVQPHKWQPTRLSRPWDSPGKSTGVGCHFLLQCMKVKSESKVAQSCLTLSNPMDCSLPGSSVHGIFQARVLDGFHRLLLLTHHFSLSLSLCPDWSYLCLNLSLCPALLHKSINVLLSPHFCTVYKHTKIHTAQHRYIQQKCAGTHTLTLPRFLVNCYRWSDICIC